VKATRVPAELLGQLTSDLSPASRAEMAVPSYCHWNPLIRWLFWARLDEALGLAELKADESVFEFGVGSGILLPTLHRAAHRVAGTDLFLSPAREMVRRLDLDSELVPIEEFAGWADVNRAQFDCIFALDVLEHVEDDELVELSQRFVRLLSPRGRLIVSGPTETTLYKLGRFVAGFKNEYHHRSIFDIRSLLQQGWRSERSVLLPRRPLPAAFLVSRYHPINVAD
jgi:hypothetical protein